MKCVLTWVCACVRVQQCVVLVGCPVGLKPSKVNAPVMVATTEARVTTARWPPPRPTAGHEHRAAVAESQAAVAQGVDATRPPAERWRRRISMRGLLLGTRNNNGHLGMLT